jgi:tetratricopeptide (TPR) repeat protein
MSTQDAARDSKSSRKSSWKTVLAIVGLAALAIATVAWIAQGDSKRDDALAACRKGDFKQAEPALKEVLSRSPNDVDVLDCLARGYFKLEQYAEAEPHLSKLILLRPNDAEYLRQRMTAYDHLKRREEAYADCRRLLELTPDDTELRGSAIGRAYQIGRYAEAEEYCRELLKAQPKDRRLRLDLADIRKARGDDEAAAKIFDELIAENANDYGALLGRGILYDETAHPDLAVPLLRKVFDGNPYARRTAGTELAKALSKIGKQEEADRVMAEANRLRDVAISNEAIKSQPDNLELKVRLAEDLFHDGNFADGEELLKKVLEQSPNYAPAHLALAKHYEKQGQSDLAAKHRRLAGKGP